MISPVPGTYMESTLLFVLSVFASSTLRAVFSSQQIKPHIYSVNTTRLLFALVIAFNFKPDQNYRAHPGFFYLFRPVGNMNSHLRDLNR